MRFLIAAVGRLKAGPERELYARYEQRIKTLGRSCGMGPLELCEIPEDRSSSAEQRRQAEAAVLMDKSSSALRRIVLDEKGRQMTSVQFASHLTELRDEGCPDVCFLIGGPDGHGDAARANSDLTMSISGWTLPHGLVRVVLAEQLYRAVTLATGHPYHRD